MGGVIYLVGGQQRLEPAYQHVGIAPGIHLGTLLAVGRLMDNDIAVGTDVGNAETPVSHTHIEYTVFLASCLTLSYHTTETTVGAFGDEDGVVSGSEEVVVGIDDLIVRHAAVCLIYEEPQSFHVCLVDGCPAEEVVQRLSFLAHAKEARVGFYLLFRGGAVGGGGVLIVDEIASVGEDAGEVALATEVCLVAFHVDIYEEDMAYEWHESAFRSFRS